MPFTAFEKFCIKRAFSPKVRARVWKKIAVQVQHGLPLLSVLRLLERQARDRKSPLAKLYAKAVRDKSSGNFLGSSFKEFCTSNEVMLIVAAEQSGEIQRGLMYANEYLDSTSGIRKAIISALSKPVFYSILSILLFVVVAVFVVPQLALASDPKSWKGAAAFLYIASEFTTSIWGAATGIGLFLLLFAIFWSLPRLVGEIRKKLDNYGPYAIYKILVGTNWLFTAATLMRSGMQLSHILQGMKASSVTTPYLREKVSIILQYFMAGNNIGEAMYLSRLNFPSRDIVDDMRVYARMPDLDKHFVEIANSAMEDGMEEALAKIKTIGSVFTGLVYAEILMIVVSTLTLTQQLQTQFGA